MKFITFILICLLTYSCVPIQIAPQIKDYKIKKGKRFKRKLPKQQAYIFENPHGVDSFYYFFNTNYQQNDIDIAHNIAITIDHRTYYLSFFEAEKKTKILNLIPSILDSNDDNEISSIEKRYIVLMVRDVHFNDALKKGYRERDKVTAYLSKLKTSYISSITYD